MPRWGDASARRRHLWDLVFGGAALLVLLVPVWAFRSFPSQDGPDHVYNARVFLLLLEGRAGAASAFYELHLDAFPNWFSHASLATLMTVLPPLWAERVLLTLYVLCLPASFGFALCAIRPGAGHLAWLSVPFVYNKWLHEGYYNRSFALVPFFLALGYFVRRRGRLRAGEAVALGLLALWTYFCTVATFLVLVGTLGLLAGAFALEERGGIAAVRRRLPVLLALTPGLLLYAAFQAGQAPETTGTGPSMAERALYLGNLYDVVAYDRREVWIGGALAAALGVALSLALARRLQERRLRWEDSLLVAAGGLLLAYFLAPEVSIPGVVSEPLHLRVSLHVHLALLVWLAQILPLRAARVLCGLALLASIGLTSVRLAHYQRLNELVDEETSVAAAIPVGSVFLPISYDHDGDRGAGRPIPEEWIIGPLRHAGSRVAVLRDLVSVDNYQADTLHFPLRYRPGANANELLQSRLDGDPGCVRIARFNRLAPKPIDYVLVFRRALAPANACARTTLGHLDSHYDRVAVSPGAGLAEVFRRRPE
jgi:hypothetical protein